MTWHVTTGPSERDDCIVGPEGLFIQCPSPSVAKRIVDAVNQDTQICVSSFRNPLEVNAKVLEQIRRNVERANEP